MLDSTYQLLLKRAITENHKIEKQLQRPLQNYDKLYYQTQIQFKEDRTLNIRWIKFPTFITQNNPNYYTVFFNNIEFWRKGELKQIYKQTMECIDKKDIDSYTIFLTGKLFGHFDPYLKENTKYYKTFIFNTTCFEEKQQETSLKIIQNFIKHRCQKMQKDGKIFGNIQKDIDRLNQFNDFVSCIYSNNINRIVIRSSNNVSNNIIRKGGNGINAI